MIRPRKSRGLILQRLLLANWGSAGKRRAAERAGGTLFDQPLRVHIIAAHAGRQPPETTKKGRRKDGWILPTVPVLKTSGSGAEGATSCGGSLRA